MTKDKPPTTDHKCRVSRRMRHALGRCLQAILGWIPGLPGIFLRGVAYRAALHGAGKLIIESGVTILGFGNVFFQGSAKLSKHTIIDARKGTITIGNGFQGLQFSRIETRRGGCIEIGKDCRLRSFTLLVGGSLHIGNDFFANRASVIDSTQASIHIGNHALLGYNCLIIDTLHGYRERGTIISQQPLDAADISIGNDVWLASNCVVNAGVRIADGVVAGAGAVVLKDVGAYCIVGGVPAKVIGHRE